jgi:hypothetical protein
MNDTSKSFYAIVELMGHQKMVGLVTEVELAGRGFLLVDSLDSEGKPSFSRYVNPEAIYAINPVSEEIAKKLAIRYQPVPVNSFELPQLRDKIAEEIMQSMAYKRRTYEDRNDPNEEEF